jgi:hypothetical protein
MHWPVLLLIGGAANFLAIRAFQEYYAYMLSPNQVAAAGYYFVSTNYIIQISIIPLILLFLFPIFLSVMLSRIQPEKMVVSPLYIQLVTLAGILIYSFSGAMSFSDSFSTGLLGAAYTLIGGAVQERATTTLFGISANRDAIVSSTLEVLNATVEDVVRILSDPKFANNLAIDLPSEKFDEHTSLFKSPRGFDMQTRVEVTNRSGQTMVNIACFQRARYYLRYSQELQEYERAEHVYLKDALSRSPSPTEPNKMLFVQEPDEKHDAILLDSIIDETQGWWVETQKLNRIGWAKAILFFVALAIVAYFIFWLKDFASGYATLALIFLYVVFELPSRLRRR